MIGPHAHTWLLTTESSFSNALWVTTVDHSPETTDVGNADGVLVEVTVSVDGGLEAEVGASVGRTDGPSDIEALGETLGDIVGTPLPRTVGTLGATLLGDRVGWQEGVYVAGECGCAEFEPLMVGAALGGILGTTEGSIETRADGATTGAAEGSVLDWELGCTAGCSVG